jgi:hypothetical protein
MCAFGGLPPFLPLARAASALASLVALPPLRPNATAAGFLRGMALVPVIDVLLCQGRDALHRQLRQLSGERLKRGDVPRFQGGVTAGHQVAACGIHAPIKPNRLGFVNRVKWA